MGIAYTSAWEDQQVLPRLHKGGNWSVIRACLLLLRDDSGAVCEVKATLAKRMLNCLGYSNRTLFKTRESKYPVTI